MQNTTTQPQNFYTKPGMPQPAPKLNLGKKPMQQNGKKMKPKQIFSVLGVVLFAIVAIMGVLIAQKQVANRGENVTPVAPTAPGSRPSASTYEPNNCSTSFNVTGETGVCDTKKAFTDFTTNNGEEILADSSFNVGDEFVFQIRITQPSNGLAEDITVIDVLPDSLTFVEGLDSSTYTLKNNGQTITTTISSMEKSDVINIEFRVRVNNDNFGRHVNTAGIEGINNFQAGSCSYNFKTLKGITKCVSKEMYNLSGELIFDGGALTRGEEYEYRITVSATNRSLGEVKIHDDLPTELEYVRPAAGSAQYITNDPTTGLLTANFGILEDEEITLGFIMKVPEDLEPTDFENIAKVYAFPINSKQAEPLASSDICSVKNVVLPIGTAECISKEAFNINGTEITSGSEIEPGQTFTYKVTVLAEQTTTGPVVLVDKLPVGLEYIQDSSNTSGIVENPNGTLTIDLGTMQTGQTEVVEFMVQLVANPTVEVFNNTALITTNSQTEHSCSLSIDLKKEYSCNSECETDANCAEIGDDHICYTTDNGDQFCRLDGNEDNISCDKPRCGDGVVHPGEACDDGNTIDNDNCTNECTIPTCGDGIVQTGETCDDGNTNNTDSCRNDCSVPSCGDGTVDTGEACDDGNTNNTDFCSNTCTLPTCGDGTVQTGEACDDGNTDNTDSCSNTCTLPTCGDGTVQTGEECDDGNTNNTDSCRNNCYLPSCGDGIIDTGETCDDGNTASGDGCSSSCNTETRVVVTPIPTPAIGCNDVCVQNADCANIDHICVTVTKGVNRCRLADYVNSDTCTEPVVVANVPSTQPILPAELPQTGPEDWLNWLKAGLVTVGLGTALFLLL